MTPTILEPAPRSTAPVSTAVHRTDKLSRPTKLLYGLGTWLSG
jgi:hypothetical protein